jgi:hypothetical protein
VEKDATLNIIKGGFNMSKLTFLLLSALLVFIIVPGSMNAEEARSSSEPIIVIQAEDYEECGREPAQTNPVEFNFTSAEQFNGVKIRETNDGDYYVENMGKNEWLAYTVTIPQSGWYSVNARVASANDGAFRMTVGGENYVRTQAFPATGKSLAWKTINIPAVYLPGGTDVMRFISEKNNLNINWLSITKADQTPYNGIPTYIPGIVQAEEYDWGGQNVAYYDTTPGNICYYAAFRFEDVDVEDSPHSGSIINVGWIASGEWMEYIIYIQYTARYYPYIVAAAPTGGRANITIYGQNCSGTFSFTSSGDNQDYESFSTSWVDLYQGTYIMRVTSYQALWNFDKLVFYWTYIPGSEESLPPASLKLEEPFPYAMEER